MIKGIIKFIIHIWLIVSIVLSVMASVNPKFYVEGGGIEHRKGFLVVQVETIKVDDNGQGYDRAGYPVTAEEDCVAVMIYNPFTNYFDDVIARWDF